MKHQRAKPTQEVAEFIQKATDPSLEELRRSYDMLEALIAALPRRTKKELVDLLQTLARSNESQETMNSVHQRALQIVSDICKPNSPQEAANLEYEQEMGERRQRDRRQK